MIGTPVECSVWRVSYRHANPDPQKQPPLVGAEVYVLTADPGGLDVVELSMQVAAKLTGGGRPLEGYTVDCLTRIASGVVS